MPEYTEEQIQRAAQRPDALKQDDPPFLRFEEGTVEDREESLRAGKSIYAPRIMVYARARGDTKSEVPDVVRGWKFETKIVEKEIKRPMTRWVDGEDGPVEQQVMVTDTVQEEFKYRTPTTPWMDKLKERLYHGFISQKYFDYCVAQLAAWEQKREAPLDGTPVVEWNQITGAMQRTLIELGIKTIEHVAEMNDSTMDVIGMGARDLKKKAINYLKVSSVGAGASEVTALQQQNELLKSQLSRLSEKMADLDARQEAQENPPKRKPGRPKKEQEDSEAA